MQSLIIQNGANLLLNGTYANGSSGSLNRFTANNNPSLRCIYVDDVANCNAKWLSLGNTSNFVNSTID
ncbi:MAG: hypothetical protein H7174_10750 [Flavobacterium sp.]|nr:hypothetical protein [Flavobacterium sp.]